MKSALVYFYLVLSILDAALAGVVLQDGSSLSATSAIFSPSDFTSVGTKADGLSVYVNATSVGRSNTSVPVSLVVDGVSFSPIAINSTKLTLSISALEATTAYVSTVKQYQASSGKFQTGDAVSGSLLQSFTSPVASEVSLSPTEQYILLIKSDAGPTTAYYTLDNQGFGITSLPGGMRVAASLDPGNIAYLGTVSNASTMTYNAQVAQGNVNLYFMDGRVADLIYLSGFSNFLTSFQPNQVITAGQSASYVLSPDAGTDIAVIAFAPSSTLTFPTQESTSAPTFTFDFTLTTSRSSAIAQLPSVSLSQSASSGSAMAQLPSASLSQSASLGSAIAQLPSASLSQSASSGSAMVQLPSSVSISQPLSSGLSSSVFALAPQIGVQGVTQAAALLGAAGVTPLPGTVVGPAVQSSTSQIHAGALQPSNVIEKTQNQGIQFGAFDIPKTPGSPVVPSTNAAVNSEAQYLASRVSLGPAPAGAPPPIGGITFPPPPYPPPPTTGAFSPPPPPPTSSSLPPPTPSPPPFPSSQPPPASQPPPSPSPPSPVYRSPPSSPSPVQSSPPPSPSSSG